MQKRSRQLKALMAFLFRAEEEDNFREGTALGLREEGVNEDTPRQTAHPHETITGDLIMREAYTSNC